YKLDGKLLEHFPASIKDLTQAEPVLRTFKGWKQPLGQIRDYDDLPREARDYVAFIEEFTETKIEIISVGYDRRDTFVRKSPWIRS
ncbi:MAG: adenylosuccinate synthetase, partial [Spirochaetia bacterium]|nr:adenylosuccinate synthetase [Spirochaetia bacterium]